MNEINQDVWVVTGGTIDSPWLKEQIKAYQREAKGLPFFIGVDGGVATLVDMGYIPNYILGDFDTLDASYREALIERGVETTQLDPVKDVTDTHAVLDWLASKGYVSFRLYGYNGSRMDHTMANMLVPFDYDIFEDVQYMNKTNIVYFHQYPKEWYIQKKGYRYLSIVPIEPLSVLETKGLKYRVENKEFKVYDSYGISNEIIDEACRLKLGKGKGWIILSND